MNHDTVKERVIAPNVVYEPCESVFYIVCPECGDYIYYYLHKPNTEAVCSCGLRWKVKRVGIGTKK